MLMKNHETHMVCTGPESRNGLRRICNLFSCILCTFKLYRELLSSLIEKIINTPRFFSPKERSYQISKLSSFVLSFLAKKIEKSKSTYPLFLIKVYFQQIWLR